jgi:hypothetical protein
MFEKGVVENLEQSSVLISEREATKLLEPRLQAIKPNIVCPLCSRVYDSIADLRRHMEIISKIADAK